MTELRLTQANVSGTDSDGSRDGRFLRELDAAYTDYQLVADCRPGVYPLNKAVSYHWFRFKLPLPKDELISIGDASLQLHWNPSIGNVNRDNSLSIKVHVVNFSGADAEIPEDASEAASYLSSSFSVVLEPGWLSLNPGSVDGHVYLSGFGEALQQATIDQASWAEDNHVLIILEPVDFNKSAGPRHPTFYTWSFIKANSLDEELAPKLIIDYDYATPMPVDVDGSVVDEIDIQQLVSIGSPDPENLVEQTLEFEQDIDYGHTHVRSVEHAINIFQDVNRRVSLFALVEHRLLIRQDISKVQERELFHNLSIDSYIPSYQSPLQAYVSNDIGIEQDVNPSRQYLRELEHELLVTQDVTQRGVLFKEFMQTLLFSQDVETDLTDTPKHQQTLEVEQDISFNMERSRSLEHELDIQQAISYYLEPTVCRRADLVPAKDISLTPSNTFVLEYPVEDPTHTVTLRPPILSNREEQHKKRIQRKSRGGELFTYWSNLWGETNIHRYKFEALSDDQREDLVSFLQASIGKVIKITDHESRSWEGVILNPNGEIVRILRDCGTTAELDIDIFK